MPIVPMADAVAGQVASSAEYNKIIDNVEGLDERLQDVEDLTDDASIGNAALDGRMDTVEARTTNGTYGNTALDTRLGTVETRTTHASTGNTALGTRVSSLESTTSHASTGNSALGTRVTTLETRTTSGTIGNQKLRDDLDALAGEVDTSRGRHIFTGSRNYGPGVNDQSVANWSAAGGNSSYVTLNSTTSFTLTQTGRWAITMRASSDGGTTGISEVRIAWPSGGMPDNGIYDARWRGGGFSGAGKLIQVLSWTGYITSGHIANNITVNCAWSPSSGSTAITYNFYFEAYFLGA